ncbi:hypothetical protein AAMO2058_001056600 [Amorphochlora amoebiformis]
MELPITENPVIQLEDDEDDEDGLDSKSIEEPKTGRKKPTVEREGNKMIPERIAAGFFDRLERTKVMPKFVKRIIATSKPYIPAIAAFLRAIGVLFYDLYSFTMPVIYQNSNPQIKACLIAFIGIVMVFFGGSFMFLIAAVEAYRISGWEKTAKFIRDLYRNYREVENEDLMDDARLASTNKRGQSKEANMTDEDYLNHKVALILSVVRPQQVIDACSGISAGFFAVIATIRIKFAEAVTLGVSIGQMFEKFAVVTLVSELEDLFGKYKNWVRPIISYICRLIGISFAYSLYRIRTEFHSATRGGHLIMYAIGELSGLYKIGIDEKDSKMLVQIHLLKLLIGIIGLISQLRFGYDVYFPLNILLAPALFADWLLGVIVGMS